MILDGLIWQRDALYFALHMEVIRENLVLRMLLSEVEAVVYSDSCQGLTTKPVKPSTLPRHVVNAAGLPVS